MFKKVAIIVLGMMGGSLGLALKARGDGCVVVGYARRETVRAQALAAGAVDSVHTAATAAVEGSDLVVLCTPVLSIPDLVTHFRPALKSGAIVTDVGSTKAWLAQALAPLMKETGAVFVGSHPMAGSELTGLDAARATLYEEACVIVTPGADQPQVAIEAVVRFWEQVRSRVYVMRPADHDALIARTSHLPHLTAALLMATADRDETDIGPFCGPGFRDSTRIAAGSEAVWHDIVKSNAGPIREELARFRREADALDQLLAAGDFESIRRLLATSREKRNRLANRGRS